MTRFEPNLAVRRMIVLRQGTSVADISFHRGLNVITGENSSGKTTLIRFLAFSLGAENIKFNSTALLCDTTLCEVELNAAVLTLRRTVTDKPMSGLAIFWGPLSEALDAGITQWQSFGFRRIEGRLSFSQVLFRALDVPELRGDAGNNVTMHQLMRLMYSDQETPGAELFRAERFDSPITRQAVGEYMLGIDDNDLYDLQLRAIALEKEEGALGSALRAVYSALGKAGTNISLEFLDERVRDLAGELQQARASLHDTEYKSAPIPGEATKDNDQARDRLTEIHRTLSSLKDRRLKLEQQISDAELLLVELQQRISEIEESISAATYLGAVRFSICPCCLNDISTRPLKNGICNLCNSNLEEGAARTQLVRMRNELALQLAESEQVKRDLHDERNTISIEISAGEEKLALLESQFLTTVSSWRTGYDIQRDQLLTQIGRVEEEIRQLVDLRKLAQSLDEQQASRAAIASELARIRDNIVSLKQAQSNRRENAYETVARHLQTILRADIPRAKEFANPESVSFDFGSNSIVVNGQRQFSASSMVYLRHAFHLALLFASLEKAYFRFPRIVIIDGVEDGGMELERSHNFQEVIYRLSQASQVEHQIIYATSSIAPSVNDPAIVVGRKFTHQQRSLQIL
jgi:hypothetical protein